MLCKKCNVLFAKNTLYLIITKKSNNGKQSVSHIALIAN